MTENNENLTPPKSGIGDTAHAITKGIVGQIPVIGSAAAELFGLLVSSPLDRRKGKWMEEVADAVRRIEARFHRSAEELAQDEKFMDTFLRISNIAVRTSQQEKREALRNALVNSASTEPLDESIQHMFVTWVDELTVWHLLMLELLADPVGWFRRRELRPPEYHLASSLAGLVKDAIPELAERREFLEQVTRDLNNRGLAKVDHNSLFTMMSGSGAFGKRSSNLGDQFLAFIADPKQ